MHIPEISPEAVPFAKTGGLADVAGALPRPMAEAGHSVSLFLPFYKAAQKTAADARDTGLRVSVPLGDETVSGEIWRSTLPGAQVSVYLVKQDELFWRDGLYGDGTRDHPDNARRFIFLSRAVLEALPELDRGVDVVHCHDWQSALVPVYLRTLYAGRLPRAKTVLTIHNLAYQGTFWHWDMKLTGLPWDLFNWRQLEFFGKLNFLKGGLVFADALTTVSPRYAQEIQTPEFGCGLEDTLAQAHDRLTGILNGIDGDIWNPETDPLLPARYRLSDLSGKRDCKRHLQRKLGLATRDVPLLAMITRLVDQKGLDLLIPILPTLLEEGVELVILGTGDEAYHRILAEASRRHAGRMSVTLGFDNRLAHEIEAGADLFLMPSRFEPCGLNQMYSLRYGTVPVVRETGGLADSVVDCSDSTLRDGTGTGVSFRPYTAEAFLGAIRRALDALRSPDVWDRLVRNGMQKDFGWEASARRYLQLFESVSRP